MILKTLSLTNFKNISEANLEFSPKINCLLGNNGMGKSNLLDAIHYLSFARSYGRLPDAMLIKTGEDFAILSAKYGRQCVEEEIKVGLRRNQRKSFRRGGKEYKKLSQHIGLLPAVMIAPADLALVTETAEERRRFADMIISQSNSSYLEALIRYSQSLEQRNRMLREGIADATLYEAVETMMDMSARIITTTRREFVEQLSDIFHRYYLEVADKDEAADLAYKQSGEWYTSLSDALEHARTRDTLLRHTSVGPHRDDIVFTLQGMPVKQTASQGQTKTFTIALRLAQYDFLNRATGMKPLLLLDDIFDKLDTNRVERIMNIVRSNRFGQIFITDTNRQHLDEIMRMAAPDYKIWDVVDGRYTLLTPDAV